MAIDGKSIEIGAYCSHPGPFAGFVLYVLHLKIEPQQLFMPQRHLWTR